MTRMRLLWLGVLLLLALWLAACMPGSTPAVAPTPTFWPTAIVPEKPTYTVERGEVIDSLTFTGRVSPIDEEELYFRSDGRVLEVYVERGDSVQSGDKLAELDVDALYRQLAQAALSLETARTDLTSAETDRAHDLARAQLDLQLAQTALAKLQDYDRDIDLSVVEADLDGALLDLQRAQAAYDAVAHQPNVVMLPEAEALQQATMDYERAQAAYDQAVRQGTQRDYDIETQRTQIEMARLEVERLQAGVDPRLEQSVTKAELELADLQAQITDTLILAPFDGEVTVLSTSPGKAVEGFKPVVVVADPTQLEITAQLSHDEMRELSEGQEATAVPVEFPGQEIPATIRSLPYPYGSGGGATGLEDEDESTRLTADLGSLEVEPGDLVRVTVILERKGAALWLPPAAIRTFEGRKFVIVQEASAQRQVDVSLGIESDERVEITSGLEEGQVVIGP